MFDEGFRFLSYRPVSFLRVTMTLFILPLILSILPRGVLKRNFELTHMPTDKLSLASLQSKLYQRVYR